MKTPEILKHFRVHDLHIKDAADTKVSPTASYGLERFKEASAEYFQAIGTAGWTSDQAIIYIANDVDKIVKPLKWLGCAKAFFGNLDSVGILNIDSLNYFDDPEKVVDFDSIKHTIVRFFPRDAIPGSEGVSLLDLYKNADPERVLSYSADLSAYSQESPAYQILSGAPQDKLIIYNRLSQLHGLLGLLSALRALNTHIGEAIIAKHKSDEEFDTIELIGLGQYLQLAERTSNHICAHINCLINEFYIDSTDPVGTLEYLYSEDFPMWHLAAVLEAPKWVERKEELDRTFEIFNAELQQPRNGRIH